MDALHIGQMNPLTLIPVLILIGCAAYELGTRIAGSKRRNGQTPANREMQRFAVNEPVRILWRDARGAERRLRAHVLDMSEYSAGLKARHPLPEGSMIIVQSPSLQMTGAAYVRRCTRSGRSFIIGVEFKGCMMRTLKRSA